jgi:hypothetical protein
MEGDAEPSTFFIGERELHFSVGSDPLSKEKRATEMREFLEKEIGVEKLSLLRTEIHGTEAEGVVENPVAHTLDHGIVMIAHQLFVREHDG